MSVQKKQLPPPPPNRIFATDGTDTLTFSQMASKRDRIASSLSSRLPSDIVAGAIYGKNSVGWLLAHQVCQVMGLRFSPINWHLVSHEIEYIVNDCDADVLFFSAEYASVVAEIRSKCPRVKLWVCIDADLPGFTSLRELENASPEGAKPPPHTRKGGQIGYTGGTTGKPKGAVRSGGMDPQRAMMTLKEWGMLRMMPHPIQLVCAPLYHAMPTAWLAMGLNLGTTFVLMPKFDPVNALKAIDEHKVNGFYMPPILLKRLLQLPEATRAGFKLRTVRTILSSGAACPTSVKQGIHAMFGPVLFEIYGASELGAVTIMDPDNMLKKPLSCGKPAFGIDVILLDDKKQKVDTPRSPGEIFVKGWNIDRYHKLEAKTEEAKHGDYFSVGDVGYFDEEGFLYISDRKIDMVVSGGVNIYPAQVEEVLHQHPDVEDVAVFGLPDPEYGEKVHAAIKLAPSKEATAQSLLAWCEGKIGKFQLPRAENFSFHSENFPRTEAGKLRKKVLRAEVMARTTSSKL